MFKYWHNPSLDKIFILINSTSRPESKKMCEISDLGARCLTIEEAQSVAPEIEGIVDCPACNYGKKCNRCRQIEAAIGVGVNNV